MSKNLLLILTAGVDIWAALYITQIHQPPTWEVSVAMSTQPMATASSEAETIQVWLKKDGTSGIWPDVNHAMTIDDIQLHLRRQRDDVQLRLLCDKELTIKDWGPTAAAFSASVSSVHIAPLPE